MDPRKHTMSASKNLTKARNEVRLAEVMLSEAEGKCLEIDTALVPKAIDDTCTSATRRDLSESGTKPDGGEGIKRTLSSHNKSAHKKRAKKCYGRNVPDDLGDKKETVQPLWFEAHDLLNDSWYSSDEVGGKKDDIFSLGSTDPDNSDSDETDTGNSNEDSEGDAELVDN